MTPLYFYELHEGATDLMSDALLVSETQHSPEAFAALVEAVARELERNHGFTYIGDEKLTASMSVGMEADDTYLVEQSGEFRSMIVEMDRSGS